VHAPNRARDILSTRGLFLIQQSVTQQATGLPRGSDHRNPSSFELETGQRRPRPAAADLQADAEHE
jgi:hypothetical protein